MRLVVGIIPAQSTAVTCTRGDFCARPSRIHCAYGKADEQRPTAGNRTEARLMSSTRTPLTGNPLAVFTDARGLTDKGDATLARDESFRNNFCPAASLTAEPGIKDQIIGSSFWRDAKSPSRTGIARASGSVEPTAQRETRALPSRSCVPRGNEPAGQWVAIQN